MFTISSALVVTILTFSAAAFGADAGASLASDSSRVRFELGGQTSWIIYKEPGLMQEVGAFFGVNGGMYIPFNNAIELDIKGELTASRVKYDGFLQSTSSQTKTPYSSSGNDYIYYTKALIGAHIEASSAIDIFPDIGLGLRYLNDKLDSPYGYEREITYFYLPLGAKITYLAGGGFSFGLNAEYDELLQGVARTHLEDVGSSTVDNAQRSGYGFRLSVPVNMASGRLSYWIEPYYQYWNIADSEKVSVGTDTNGNRLYLLEPANNSNAFGLNFGVQF